MQTGRAKKREGGRRRLQLDTLSLAFCPHAIIRWTEHISAHWNAFNAGYPERGSVPMTEKMTTGMQQG